MKRALAWCLIFSLLLPVVALAGQVTCYVTADNHYGLYVGGPAGENLTFYGRDVDSWPMAETLFVDLNEGEYIYIAAWDYSGPAGVAGDFLTDHGDFTTDGTWSVALTEFNGLGDASPLPTDSEIENAIQLIETQDLWEPALELEQNATYYVVPNISPEAWWIWKDAFDAHTGVLLMFRSDLSGGSTATESTSWGDVKTLFR